LRIVAYNFLGGGSAARDAWAQIARLQPDVLLAQECRRPDLAGSWSEARAGRWGTGIFLSSGDVRRIPVRGFDGWIEGGELDVRLSHRPLRVFSVHCPPGEHGYIKTMHALLDSLAPVSVGADLILGGDFNVATGVRGPRDLVRFSKGERLLLERMSRDFDLIPCWQSMHPRSPLAQTLRWSGNRSTPYHCDGIFAPRALRDRLVKCEVIAGPRWERLSDHNPVLAVFTQVTFSRSPSRRTSRSPSCTSPRGRPGAR
jgi:exonuclease III